jgi:polysaccharide export outer membrane protein
MYRRVSRVFGPRRASEHRWAVGLWAALTAAVAAGAGAASLKAQTPARGPSVEPSAAAPLPPSRAIEYLINPEDTLDIYVYDVPELSREYTVGPDGNVTVPLLPKGVAAAGLTPDQFARSLEETFRQSGRLSHPQITVSVKQSRRSMVTVDGAVKSPQTVPVMGPTLLLAVLSQCGGRADDAGNVITISRGEVALHELADQGVPASTTAKVEFKKLMNPDDPASKTEVWPGDRVFVEHAGLFYVLGQVARPGGYNLTSADEQVSVLDALALAGDATSIAKVDKTMLIRKDPKALNGRDEIALNLKDILEGRSPDQILKANDILYVPASGSRRAVHSAGAVATTMAAAAGAAVVYTRF